MIDEAWVEGVQKIANYRFNKDYPLVGRNHFATSDVKYIIESFLMLLEEYVSKDTRGAVQETPISGERTIQCNSECI